jgi:L-threonylcarbamoyladenylate synthase
MNDVGVRPRPPGPVAPDPAGLARAVALLRTGRLVAFPTETVYGLGANAQDADAVRRIFAVKGRPADNPLIVHLPSADELVRVVAQVTPLARRLAAAYWPGPLTVVLEAAAGLPRVTTGGLGTVAVRVPDHPVASALLEACALPVAAPSANRSGRPSPTTAAHVVDDLGDLVDLVLDGGPCPVGVESTVVDARGRLPVVLREGTITREQLGIGWRSATSTSPAEADHVSAPPAASPAEADHVSAPPAASPAEADHDPAPLAASPGTRYRHYAPACAVELVPAGHGPERAAAVARTGVRVGLVGPSAAPTGVVEIARVADVAALAQQLYAALRRAEDEQVEVLVVESVPETGLGRAVMDRLRRAAS